MLVEKWLIKNLKQVLLSCRDSLSVSKTHAIVITSGLLKHGNSAPQLISSYARTCDFLSARKLFDHLPNRQIDSCNAMLVGYSRANHPREVISTYKRLCGEGIKPDSSTFTIAIKACTTLLDFDLGEEIWKLAGELGYEDDVFVGSAMLNLYAIHGKIDNALNLFENLTRKDVVSWSTMIAGFVRSRRVSEAIDMYRRMRKEGLKGDSIVMLALIQAFADLDDQKVACSLHGHMIREGFDVNVMVETSLVDMYAKNGRLDYAIKTFRRMQCRNAVSWSALVSGYAQKGHAKEALELLIEMQTTGIEPDSVSLVSALLSCSQLGFPLLGRAIHGYTVRRIKVNQIMSTALIDMYAKCGSLSCARALHDRMTWGDIISWNTIISSYGIHGRGEEALSLFNQMIEAHVEPDHATFASLLSALSHSGLVDEGKYWFNTMVKKYNIQPMEKHCVSLIDLLARAGRVEEAQYLINTMRHEPGIAVWVALLSGCLNHKKFQIGEIAAKKVVELKPDCPGIYTLVSNFFAAAKKWDKVAIARTAMRAAGMQKVPGYSTVELNGKLQSFLVEDTSHPQYEQIMAILNEMENKMKLMRR